MYTLTSENSYYTLSRFFENICNQAFLEDMDFLGKSKIYLTKDKNYPTFLITQKRWLLLINQYRTNFWVVFEYRRRI